MVLIILIVYTKKKLLEFAMLGGCDGGKMPFLSFSLFLLISGASKGKICADNSYESEGQYG